MSAVNGFYETTIELIQLLEEVDQVDRDVKVNRVEELLIKREGLMEKMEPPFTDSEQQIGKQLIDLNNQLTKLLEAEKKVLQVDLLNLKKKKKNATKYVNPYESLSPDGVFYDKRK